MGRSGRVGVAVVCATVCVGCGRGPFGQRSSGGDDDGGGVDEQGEYETDGCSQPRVDDCNEVPADAPTFGLGYDGALDFPLTRCNPRQNENDGTHICCSDDPAALGGALPDYEGRGVDGGTPFFSGGHNRNGTSGVCTRVADIVDGLRDSPDPGCPAPCNPTWSDADVQTVCGIGAMCCQTMKLDPRDCTQIDGIFRPVTGQDIFDGITDWAPARHNTHQSPGGQGCTDFGGGNQDLRTDCIRWLTVANQRGFCMPAGSCNVDPDYVDACEQLNATGG